MENVLKLKFFIEKLYRKYDYWMIALSKFITVLVFLLYMSSAFPNVEIIILPVFLAIIIAGLFLPWSLITFMCTVVMAVYMYGISPEICMFTVIFILVAAIAASLLRIENTMIVIFAFLAFALKIPYAGLMIIALSSGMAGIIAFLTGIIIYFYCDFIRVSGMGIAKMFNGDIESIIEAFRYLIENSFSSRIGLAYIFAFSAAYILIYMVKNLDLNYGNEISAYTGGITAFILLAATSSIISIEYNFTWNIFSIIISLIITEIYILIFHAARYNAVKTVRFEDDDYFYIVKLVPKLKGSAGGHVDEEE